MTLLVVATGVFVLVVGGRRFLQAALRVLLGLVVLAVLLVVIGAELLLRLQDLLARARTLRDEGESFWASLPSLGAGSLAAACLGLVLLARWFQRREGGRSGEPARDPLRERPRVPPSAEEDW